MVSRCFYKTPQGGAWFSAILPGLGLFTRGFPAQGFSTLALGGVLTLFTCLISQWGGSGVGVFLGMLLILPWWVFQVFQASLPVPLGLVKSWNIVWSKGYDIQYLGGLFFLAAITDLSIILANPSYHLHVFCTRPTGLPGLLAKIQSPTFHVIIGYGFLRRRPWALLVYFIYAGYGFLNATVNFACEGYGRIRIVFFITLLGFTAYVVLRRHCFHAPSPLAAVPHNNS